MNEIVLSETTCFPCLMESILTMIILDNSFE